MAKQTFEATFFNLRARVRRMGHWTGVRFLKNQGLTLEQAHVVLFGRLPRFPA
jgi:hypothetical protein